MIRPYKTADKATLIELFQLNTPKYFDVKEVEDFEKYLHHNSQTYLTIEHENRIVGGAGYRVNESEGLGSVTWIFFHPDAAGKGLGRTVMEHCLTALRSNPKVIKLVVTTSQLAYQFFEKFGYELVQITKGHWGQGLDLYLMEMKA